MNSNVVLVRRARANAPTKTIAAGLGAAPVCCRPLSCTFKKRHEERVHYRESCRRYYRSIPTGCHWIDHRGAHDHEEPTSPTANVEPMVGINFQFSSGRILPLRVTDPLLMFTPRQRRADSRSPMPSNTCLRGDTSMSSRRRLPEFQSIRSIKNGTATSRMYCGAALRSRAC